jgi:NAD(P)-dependent dehydrogenase (short-subunit alcohol dehydrogenase family)
MQPPLLTDTTALITGATSGLGYATADALARLGATVVLVSRDPQRGEEARHALAESTGSARLELLQADLASLDSIRRLSTRFLDRHPQLDILINNAGTLEPRRRLSTDGIEMTLAVNLLAPFVLSALLLDRLRQSAPARIVNLSSATQARASLDTDDLQFERRPYAMWPAYGQSKLGLALITNETARRVDGSGLTANCLHPGVMASHLGRRDGVTGVVWALASRFMSSPRAAARHVTYLATSPGVADTNGAYFDQARRIRPNPIAEDPIAGAKLWEVLEQLAQVPAATLGPTSVGVGRWPSR